MTAKSVIPSVRSIIGSAMVGLAVLCTACNENDEQAEVIPLEGRVESIKITGEGTGEITVTYFSDKQGQEVKGTGRITPETEITINGAIAGISDLREGERIHGQVRVEKKGKTRVQTALKIVVDRAAANPPPDDK